MYEQQEQIFFGEELQQINQIYIKTSYGNIFAHVVGQHGQPLIIVVHGSGPKNSADQYLYLLHQYLVRVSYAEKFFIVAIDCPGYGRSKGSKQAVKTFPLQMFKEILKDLGYNSYFAMLGHSQGGAAIFNAVYEDPKLTQFLLMDRPVCGNIKRFAKFPLPTLLLYDIEDDGHPIWQGKLLFKQLMSSQLYTYRHSQNPYWVPDHIWDLTLAFFRKYSSTRKTLMGSNCSRNILNHRSLSINKNSRQKSKSKKSHVSTSKYDQVKRQAQKFPQKQLIQISEIEKSQIYSRAADLEQLEQLPTWLNQPKIEQTEEDIKREQKEKKQRQKKYQKEMNIQELAEEPRKREKKKNEAVAQKIIKTQQVQKVEKVQKKQKSSQNIQKQKQMKDEQRAIIDKQSEQKIQKKEGQVQDKCSICHQSYYIPVQTNCKHTFCKKCIGESMLVDPRCPLCRTPINKRTQNKQLHIKILEKLDSKQKERRQRDLFQFEQMLKSNTSRELETKKSAFTKTKTKYKWELFAKEPKNFKFEQVCFNINMGQANSAPVRISHAPFVFESRGTFSFSCEITIKPKNKDYATITAIHRIDVTPGNHSKIIAVKKKKN